MEPAYEREFGDMVPECEFGTMPPSDNLNDMEALVGERLSRDELVTSSVKKKVFVIPGGEVARFEFERCSN